MEKRIVFIRHAKSDWSNIGLRDFARPLNERGLRDAPLMGQRLKTVKYIPDCILSSTAERAITTSKILAQELEMSENSIISSDELYNASIDTIERVVRSGIIPENAKTLFVVGHNPGISFIAQLAGKGGLLQLAGLPTCGMVGVKTILKSWTEFEPSACQFSFLDYPKKQQ